MSPMPGLLIAAPSSGAGKTTVTLGLLAAMTRAGVKVASAKAGPDHIDPAFHAAASGRPAVNLDPWAMRPDLVRALAEEAVDGCDGFVVESMMGLFDGAADGSGSAADLAVSLGLKVLLVVDCAKQSHSVAALVGGFRAHRADVSLTGLILNRIGSDRHERLLRDALLPLGVPILGALRRDAGLALPERHLGLVQASEHPALAGFLARAADWIFQGCDLAALAVLAAASPETRANAVSRLPPLGQRIAVARDDGFGFAYPHILSGWRRQGATLCFFSPLGDEAPALDADAVYLPGGYPELHAGRLAAASRFAGGMHAAVARGAAVYGECGGYMVLGHGLQDADGQRHGMLGLLPLETSFAARALHLGYRRATAPGSFPFAGELAAHEFHYATVLTEGPGRPLFQATDALGADLGSTGLCAGRVAGSFLHVIDRAP